jgi:alpha-mannosidase/lysosomal alpha-mannosidase
MELVINECGQMFDQKLNIKMQYSTPGQFIDALKKENAEYPIYKSDMFPYESQAVDRYHFWSGHYTSRPNLKFKVKQYSDLYHSYAKFLARNVIDQSAKEDAWPKAQSSLDEMADILALMQQNGAITGTHQAYVDWQYNHDMDKVFNQGSDFYAQEVASHLEGKYGV